MEYGILQDESCLKLFETINGCPLCQGCRKARSIFKKHETKKGRYSDVFPGFSSKTIRLPIDVLVIAESHGGTRNETFREQGTLVEEVSDLGGFYQEAPIRTFHQSEVRKLLRGLDTLSCTWVFTDLLKCFVAFKKKNLKREKAKKNLATAVGNCRRYLDDQIALLNPKIIISLGGLVKKSYFGNDGGVVHGEVIEYTKQELNCRLVTSYFPAARTADLWARCGGWEAVLQRVKTLTGKESETAQDVGGNASVNT